MSVRSLPLPARIAGYLIGAQGVIVLGVATYTVLRGTSRSTILIFIFITAAIAALFLVTAFFLLRGERGAWVMGLILAGTTAFGNLLRSLNYLGHPAQVSPVSLVYFLVALTVFILLLTPVTRKAFRQPTP